MRRILNRSEFWMAIIGGILYNIIFAIIIANSYYSQWLKIMISLISLLLGPVIFFLVDFLIQTIVEEIFENGLKKACILFLHMHVIWLPLILITNILYVISTSLSFTFAMKSDVLIISAILLIAWGVEIYLIANKT